MSILLTVVVGHMTDSGNLATNSYTEVLQVEADDSVQLRVVEKVQEIKKRWPKNLPGLQNVLSISHSVLP